MLGWNADTVLRLDLRVEAPRADAQRDALTGIGEELPRVLGDQDPGFADIFGTEAVTVGGSRNTHWYVYFRTKTARARTDRTAPCSARFQALALGERLRSVQKAHQVHYRDARTGLAQPRRDLQDAAGIRADNDIRPRREYRGDLLPLELLRDGGLRHVVDPCTPAAAFGIGDLCEHHALDRAQQRTGLGAYALAVRKMAGVLIHDAQRPRDAIRPRPHDLGRIPYARRECPAARRARGILLEHIAVRLQVRAAASRVDHDRKVGAARGRVDVESCQL